MNRRGPSGQQWDVMVDPEAIDRADTARQIVGGWFDRHVDTIHVYVARRAGEEIARDVTADTFRVALEHFDRFDPGQGGERAWLYGIASNLLHRHWRTEQRRLRAQLRSAGGQLDLPDPLLAADDHMDAQRDLARVLVAAERLDAVDRDLLILVAWERCSSTEAACALGIPPGTVRSRLNRIRMKLRNDQGPWT